MAYVEVFYLDPANGWALAQFDAGGNQIGEAEYAYHRATVIRMAETFYPNLPLSIYRKDGSLWKKQEPAS
jgi:hypothetical protein